MAGEGLGVEGLQPHRLDPVLHPGIAEGGDILAGGALRGIVDQALLEDQRMGRVDDDQPLQPVRVAQSREPGDGAAPVVANQSEAVQLQMVGEREQILDDPIGPVMLDAERLVRGAEAALVRDDDEIILRQRRRDLPPGAVQFRKTVQEDDRFSTSRPAQLDVEGDARGKVDAGLGQGHGRSISRAGGKKKPSGRRGLAPKHGPSAGRSPVRCVHL